VDGGGVTPGLVVGVPFGGEDFLAMINLYVNYKILI
jgi:hypothetical protein